jgi:hypothetical protein
LPIAQASQAVVTPAAASRASASAINAAAAPVPRASRETNS